MKKDLSVFWEQRWHPIRQEWIVYAAHRESRPWSNKKVDWIEKVEQSKLEPECYLCPGNVRFNGYKNKDYNGIFIFDNDFPGISLNAPQNLSVPKGIYKNKPAVGISKVLCYSHEHNLTLAELDLKNLEKVVEVWQKQTHLIAGLSEINSVLIFENRGVLCGASNSHPHGQLFGTNFVYKNIETYLNSAEQHFSQTGKILFRDIIDSELQDGRRVIAENDHTIAFVPYFSKHAYEVYIAPKKTYQSIADMQSSEVSDFARILQNVLIKFDNIWKHSFPYVMTINQAPTDGQDYKNFHFYIAFYPPLRKNGMQKYLGGAEIGGGNFHVDVMPETIAAELKWLSNIHYKKTS